MKPPKDALLLIDGHALLYRAFHALPPLKTKNGIPTNAIYGFITTLLKAMEDISPKYCAVAFDLSGPTFRHQAYEGYKANRAAAPDELRPQIPYAYKVVEALNIPIFTKEGFEADDVIGTLSRQAKEKKVPVVIVTGDRDSFQLVNDSTFVYTMKRTIADTMLYDAAAIKERMGVTPEQVPHFKALAGDSSDEIPGVSGIGEKTAVAILSQVKTIDDLYDKLKAGDNLGLTPRIRQKLIDGEADARQSLDLATIHDTVPIELSLADCSIHEYNPEEVKTVFTELELFSLIKRLGTIMGNGTSQELTSETPRDWQYKKLTTKEDITAVANELAQLPAIAVDTETDGLGGPAIGLSLSGTPKVGYYIPLIPEHDAELEQATIIELVKPLLEDRKVGKIGHNLKYDIAVFDKLGITLTPVAFDTMIAAYIIHAHFRTFDFDSVCQREFGYTPIPLTTLLGEKKKGDIREADGDKVAEYAAEDAIFTYRLYEHFSQQLEATPAMTELATKIDFPLIPTLYAMEKRGVCLNNEKLASLEKEVEKELGELVKNIEQYASGPINVNSPAQLQKLLFEELNLAQEGMKKTQNGISTAASELEKLLGTHPVIELIMRYRELAKLQGTYITTLPKLADQTGRIHTQFSQTTAATGRLSSSDPNLQNIPVRTKLGTEIRKAFVAPEGYELLSLDYSQIELRIIAHLSQDPALIQVFKDGRDIHDEVAKRMGVDRRAAKAINFGILYGLSAYGLAQGLKIEQKVAREYIDTYFASYPKLALYLQETREQIKNQGYVETLFGRRREIPEINASNAVVRAAAERMAINAPAQGTAADIMKLAMIQAHDWIEENYATSAERPYLILQVHDELLLECPHDLSQTVAKSIKTIMERAYPLDVPLEVDCAIGVSWGELNETDLG